MTPIVFHILLDSGVTLHLSATVETKHYYIGAADVVGAQLADKLGGSLLYWELKE